MASKLGAQEHETLDTRTIPREHGRTLDDTHVRNIDQFLFQGDDASPCPSYQAGSEPSIFSRRTHQQPRSRLT